MQILSTNAGGKLSAIDDQAAFMNAVEEFHPAWQLVFISEVDASPSTIDTMALKFGGRYTYKRYWPGPGSYAMAVVIRSAVTPHIKDITVLGRCMRVQMSVASTAADCASPIVKKYVLLPLDALQSLRAPGYFYRLSLVDEYEIKTGSHRSCG